MKRQTALIFYVLGFYVVLQFAWWGYHLIQISSQLQQVNNQVNSKTTMIIGEGFVFFILLVVGLWRIKVSINKDHKLSERQNNFLLSVTHELKTPIASNKLYLQTLVKHDFPIEKREELLKKALIENQRLEEIVEMILTATRIENQTFQLHKEWIDLNEMLSQLAENENSILGKEWVVFEAKDNVKVQVEADAFMIKTIVRNLIENALKYAPSSEKIIVFLRRENNRVKFGVEDLGPGIPAENQRLVFKKFIRLENEETRSQKGTGLGLFIASEFTRLNGGKLNYLPNKPKGSIFEITL
ncbi:MAG: ATP-binding protein [Crocinitomicaceae bacterium]|nr:ATP-binding protein [Crocinitomicaceae bacterium]